MNKKLSWFALVAAFALGLFFVLLNPLANPTSQAVSTPSLPVTNVLHAPTGDISLILADTPALQVQGLSDRPSLPDTSAMLFIFDTPDNYGFWMKDMNFPLDIIWMDSNYRIIHIEPDLSPSTYPKTFYPGGPSPYVLEANAGFAEKNNLKVGSVLNFSKISR